jgi:hypothetical protein
MHKGEQEYTTRSLGESSFLYLNGAQLLTAIDSRGFDSFTFADKDGSARRLAEQFYADATAPARSLLLAMTQLRSEGSKARRERGAVRQ